MSPLSPFLFGAALLLAAAPMGVLGAELREDLPETFRRYYVLRQGDFSLDYTVGNGRAVYTIKNVYGTEYQLRMFEELSVYDTEPNEEIEMCNGTVTDRRSGEEGVTYGSIDKSTEIFRGQFVLNGGRTTYYVEDAFDFLDDVSDGEISILYKSDDVIRPEGTFEPAIIPRSNDSVNFGHTADFTADDEDPLMGSRSNPDNICAVDLRIDNGVWNDYGQDVNKVRNAMYQHVMTANRIFGYHFKVGGTPQVKFVIGRLAIATDAYCKKNSFNVHCKRSVRGASDYLSVFSKQNFQKYCLTYMFTNRDFGSTLGVAYIGGVCDSRSSYGYNCGFVVLSKRRSQHQTDLTFAHEIGHNFGSSHDQSGSCLGNSKYGTYLMSPYASNKEQPNNRRFSSCSVSSISRIFASMASGRKTNCFKGSRSRLSQALTGDEGDEVFNGSAGSTSTLSAAVSVFLALAMARLS